MWHNPLLAPRLVRSVPLARRLSAARTVLLAGLVAALPVVGCAPEPVGNRPAYPLNQASLRDHPAGEVRAPATDRSNWSTSDDAFSVGPPEGYTADPLSGFKLPSTRVRPEREHEW